MKWERLLNGGALPGNLPNTSTLFMEASPKLWEVLENIPEVSASCRETFKDGCLILLVDENRTGGKHLWLLNTSWEAVYHSPEEVLRVTPGSIDERAIEDGRLMLIDGIFYLWYCGYNGHEGRACMARSSDLLHWEKETPLLGDVNDHQNKDHVVFPEQIDGSWYLLHRPWGEDLFPESYNMPVRLARADSLSEGVWQDLGVLLRPQEVPAHKHDWLGGGAAPISLGGGRYLELYHNAWFEKDGYRQYHLSACILDFRRGDPRNPETLVTHRLESILKPEPGYPNEINGTLRIDIVFPMTCWVRDQWLYVVYGAGDKVTCAARVRLSELLEDLENSSEKRGGV